MRFGTKMTVPTGTRALTAAEIDAATDKTPWMDRHLMGFYGIQVRYVVYGVVGLAVLGTAYEVLKHKKSSVAGYRRRKSRR